MRIVVGVFVIMLALTILFSIPAVQTSAGKAATTWFNDKYDVGLSIEGLRYSFPDLFTIREVFIPTATGDTLIYASSIDFEFSGFKSLTNTLGSSGIVLKDVKFYWYTPEGHEESTLKYFTSKFKSDSQEKSTKPPFKMAVSSLTIENGRFYYNKHNCNACAYDLRDINLEFDDFDLEGPYVSADVKSLAVQDQNSFDIVSLKGSLAYQADHILAEGLELKTTGSELVGDFKLEYEERSDLRDFVNKVIIRSEIERGALDAHEIQRFASKYPDFGKVQLKGVFEGPVNDLSSQKLHLEVGNETQVDGDFKFLNTTDSKNMFIEAENTVILTTADDARDIYSLFSDRPLPAVVDELGELRFIGNYKGYFRDFKADGHLISKLGQARANLSLRYDEGNDDVYYKGDVSVQDLNMAVLLNDTALGMLNASMELNGRGFDPVSMATELKGTVQSIDYNDYHYSNIQINGDISDSRFKGALKIRDPNLEVDFDGSASFGQDTSDYKFVASIGHADLFRLNFAKDTIFYLTSALNLDFEAVNYDDWTGSIRIGNTTVEKRDYFYFFKDIEVVSSGKDSARELVVRSELLDAKFHGDFTVNGIGSAFEHHLRKFVNLDGVVMLPQDEKFDFHLDIKNSRVLSDIFLPKLGIEPNTRIDGFYTNEGHQLEVVLNTPGISFDRFGVREMDFKYSGSDGNSHLGFSVLETEIGQSILIDSLKFNSDSDGDSLKYQLLGSLKDSINSQFVFEGYALELDTNYYKFGIANSNFNIGNVEFTMNHDNAIYIDTGGVFIENLLLQNGDEQIAVNGHVSDKPYEVLRVNINDFGLDLVNYFLNSKQARFAGDLNGSVILSTITSDTRFAADLRIDSLNMNKTYLGDLDLNSNWSIVNDSVLISSQLMIGELKAMDIAGYYQADSSGSIDFDIGFDQFRLAALNPFVVKVAENMRGYLNGNVSISGNTGSPLFEGELQLPKAAFTVSFLQTDYNLTGIPRVKITPDKILFQDIKLRDSRFGTDGTLMGSISHKNFSDINLDLKVQADKLLALNTPSASGNAYYGQAFVTGDVLLQGPPSKLNVLATVMTARNTFFNIPLDGAREVNKSNFVTFIDKVSSSDILQQKRGTVHLDGGITIEFDIAVNPSARFGIILNQQTGNEMFATGSGDIRLNIDPVNDMRLFGTYTISEGDYNFSLGGLINRKFKVLNGSTITFNGDPYNAQLNITALYSTKADPAVLVGDYEGGRTQVDVFLDIDGALQDPQIGFSVEAPRANSTVQTILTNRLDDQDKVSQQVFSLLANNSFAPDNSIPGTYGGAIVNAWDILANQATSWLNEFTGGYDISLNYQQDQSVSDPTLVGNNGSQEEIEVGVSKRFFDNRVVVNGSVGVPIGENQNQIAGDFELEYNITDDGRFRAKIFSRAVQDQYAFQQQNYQQGAGVFYRMDFDSWSEFLRRLFNSSKVKSENEKESE